jgi:Domain of unknown function (DUF397)
MEGTDAVTWRKSSFSGTNGGQCVEAGSPPGAVLVRDTANRDGGTLAFTGNAWQAFTTALKAL